MVGKHLFIDDGPRIKEDYLDIKEDEQHGDKVEFDGEAGAAFADGQHAALVSGILNPAAAAEFADEDGSDKGSGRKGDGSQCQEENRDVLCQLRIFHRENLETAGVLGK